MGSQHHLFWGLRFVMDFVAHPKTTISLCQMDCEFYFPPPKKMDKHVYIYIYTWTFQVFKILVVAGMGGYFSRFLGKESLKTKVSFQDFPETASLSCYMDQTLQIIS